MRNLDKVCGDNFVCIMGSVTVTFGTWITKTSCALKRWSNAKLSSLDCRFSVIYLLRQPNYPYMFYRVLETFIFPLSKVERAAWRTKVKIQPCHQTTSVKHYSNYQNVENSFALIWKNLCWFFQKKNLENSFTHSAKSCGRLENGEQQVDFSKPATVLASTKVFDLKFSQRTDPRTHHSIVIAVVIIATVVKVVDRCQWGVIFHSVGVHECIIYQRIV